MKKLFCLVMMFLSFTFSIGIAHAQDSELENAISQLWISGSNSNVENTLQKFTRSANQDLAEKAAFHLSCMKLMQGKQENAAEALSELEKLAKSDKQQDLVNQLKKQYLPETEPLPEGLKEKISLDVKDVDIKDVLKLIAKQTSLNIAIHKNVSTKAGVHLENVTALQALETLCKTYDMKYSFKEGIISVFPLETEASVLSSKSSMPEGFRRKISLDFRDTDVRAIIGIIAKVSGANIVVHKNVGCRATLSLVDATIEQALNALCAATDLCYERNDNIFIILPAGKRIEDYAKKEIKLTYLSGEEGTKVLQAIAGDSPEVAITAGEKSVFLEGKKAGIEKLESYLLARDKKDTAQKISVKIWKLMTTSSMSSGEFSKLDETEKKKIAQIISAPSLITLTGQKCEIKVESEKEESEKTKSDSFSYFFSCVVDETNTPDLVKLTSKIHVDGISYVGGKKYEIKKEFAPTLQIKRNVWTMIALSEEKERMYMELQISNYIK